MTNSIQFDSTEILTSAYIPQYVKHESAPERIITALQLAREDGSILISDKRGIKIITLKGTLVAASQAALDAAIDSFKELLSRKEKNLDISWNSSTRRYVANCTDHSFDRDHYNTNALPWTAEFTVLSGEGKDTSTTTALNAHSISVDTPIADSFTISGSKPAKPIITLNIDGVASGGKGVEYKNTDTGEKIQITRNKTWGGGSGKQIVIDCLTRKVTDNIDNSSVAAEGIFYGVFPTFKIGTNNVQISQGKLVNQTSPDPDDLTKIATSYSTTASTTRLAQGFFVPYTDATFSAVTLALKKTGTPGTLTVRIETDNNGQPSGTLVDANATVNVAHSSLSTGYTYFTATFPSVFQLTANTKYWIVLQAVATLDGSNYYDWGVITNAAYLYPTGGAFTSSDSGTTYVSAGGGTETFGFRVLYGGTSPSSTILHTVVYTKTYL